MPIAPTQNDSDQECHENKYTYPNHHAQECRVVHATANCFFGRPFGPGDCHLTRRISIFIKARNAIARRLVIVDDRVRELQLQIIYCQAQLILQIAQSHIQPHDCHKDSCVVPILVDRHRRSDDFTEAESIVVDRTSGWLVEGHAFREVC